jgi:hypothetical protein
LHGRGVALIPDLYFLAYLPPETIHPDLKKGLCQLVFELTQQDVNPTISGGDAIITSETVGPISTTYAGGILSRNASMPKVMAFIQPFMKNAGQALAVTRA